jgi:glutamate racemase
MNNNPVVFIDSGIGGIPYCLDFMKKNPQEVVCYLADRENFPYGPRDKEELKSILINLTKKLLEKLDPKIIVLACNTATIAALSSLRENFPQISFVGTVPAVKPAAEASSMEKVGVLGTARTIEEIDSLNLVDSGCEIFGVAAPDLVEFVEKHFDEAYEKEKTEIVQKYIKIFRAASVDTLVLGCTHFLFLLDEFRREAAPYIKVFDSLAGITKRIEYLLDENNGALHAGLRAGLSTAMNTEQNFKPEHKLFLSGSEPAGSFWETRAKSLGFNLFLLNQYEK